MKVCIILISHRAPITVRRLAVEMDLFGFWEHGASYDLTNLEDVNTNVCRLVLLYRRLMSISLTCYMLSTTTASTRNMYCGRPRPCYNGSYIFEKVREKKTLKKQTNEEV